MRIDKYIYTYPSYRVTFTRRDKNKQDVTFNVGVFKTLKEAQLARDKALGEYLHRKYHV